MGKAVLGAGLADYPTAWFRFTERPDQPYLGEWAKFANWQRTARITLRTEAVAIKLLVRKGLWTVRSGEQAAKMDAKLVVVAGDTESAEVKLRLPSIMGRGREASLTVPHPLVSRQHCEIFEKDGFLVVRDLGSLNGTFVGDERISEAVLHDGELLTVGTVTFRAVYCDDPNLSAPVRENDAADPVAIQTQPDADALPDDQESTEKQPEPIATPTPASAGPVEADDGFAAFLKSVDVEGQPDEEEAAEIGAEMTEEPSPPEIAEGIEKVDEPEEFATIDEPESVEEIPLPDGGGEVAEPEAVEPTNLAEPVELADDAQSTPAADEPSPAAAGQAAQAKEMSEVDEDELQSFLKELDI
jgi:predicted component of type VI protein secretion system